jgi:hypothetical protein
MSLKAPILTPVVYLLGFQTQRMTTCAWRG